LCYAAAIGFGYVFQHELRYYLKYHNHLAELLAIACASGLVMAAALGYYIRTLSGSGVAS
jgi:hypothetical protein